MKSPLLSLILFLFLHSAFSEAKACKWVSSVLLGFAPTESNPRTNYKQICGVTWKTFKNKFSQQSWRNKSVYVNSVDECKDECLRNVFCQHGINYNGQRKTCHLSTSNILLEENRKLKHDYYQLSYKDGRYTNATKKCVDEDTWCSGFASQCHTEAIQRRCCNTCKDMKNNLAKGECKDEADWCKKYKNTKYCSQESMKKRCCLSCKDSTIIADECKDEADWCKAYKDTPLCNETNMKKRCCLTCKDSSKIGICRDEGDWCEDFKNAASCKKEGIKKRCCQTCEEVEEICVDDGKWCEEYKNTQQCTMESVKKECCLTCKNSQKKEETEMCQDDHEWCLDYKGNSACRQTMIKKWCCATCRE